MRLFVLCAMLLGLAACATTPRTDAADACPAEIFSIYFARDQVMLDDLSNEVLDAAAGQIAGCEGARLEVAGFADPAGDPQTNREISSDRAHAVFEALLERGVTAEQVEILAIGEAGARSAEGVTEPMRRRVEVRFFPEGS